MPFYRPHWRSVAALYMANFQFQFNSFNNLMHGKMEEDINLEVLNIQ